MSTKSQDDPDSDVKKHDTEVKQERNRAERKLRQSERKYRTLFENTGAATCIIEGDTTISLVNEQFEKLSGYSKDQIEGEKSWTEFVAEGDLERMKEHHDKRRKKPDSVPNRYDFSFVDADGNVKKGLISIDLIEETSQSIASIFDITSRVKAEEKYRTVVENAHDAMYHPETGFQYVNPAFEELTGYSSEEIYEDDFDFLKLIHPDDIELIEQRAGARKRGEELTEKYKFRIIAKDSSVKTVMATTIPLPTRGQLIIGILRDITGEVSRTRLLDAFNQSAVEIEKTLTPEAMFNSASRRLKELGFHSIIYFPNDDSSGLVPKYLSFGSKVINLIENLGGLDRENYAIPNDNSTPHGQAVKNKETHFIDNVIEGFHTVLPDQYEKFAGKIVSLLNLPEKEVAAPIIVEGEVVGVFSILANNLTPEDKPTVTAFARLLGAGFRKTRFFEKTQEEISKRENAQKKLEDSKQDLKQSFIELAETTSRVLGVRDPYTQQHELRVGELAREVGRRMGLGEKKQLGLYLGGVLHDIGKIAVPETILTKPGKLKDIEWNLIKSHPEVGYNKILRDTDFPWPVTEMTLHHHERLDGSGYPDGLEGDELTTEVRILGAVDVVEAMSTRRPYRAARTKERTLEVIKNGKGNKFDSEVVEILVDMIEEEKIRFGENS